MEIDNSLIELLRFKMIQVHEESIKEHESLYLDCISNFDYDVAEYHKSAVNGFENSVDFIKSADDEMLKMIMTGQIEQHEGFDSEFEAMESIGFYVCNECFSELSIIKLEENGNDVCPLCGEPIDWEEIQDIIKEIHETFGDEE